MAIRPCATHNCLNNVRAGDVQTSRPGSTADGRYCGVCRRRQKTAVAARPCFCLDKLARFCPKHGRIA